MVKRKDFNKWNSYELDQLIDYKKQNIFEVYSLSNKKDNFQNTINMIFYRINLLILKIKRINLFLNCLLKEIRILSYSIYLV